MIFEQRGSTCGLYALINGFAHTYRFNEQTVHTCIAQLIQQNSFLSTCTSPTTLLGEFFDVVLFESFLNQNAAKITSSLSIEPFEAHIVPFGQFDDAAFYIAPGINQKKWYELKKDAVLHWLTVMPNLQTYNSAYGTTEQMTIETLTAFHERLHDHHFSWMRWRRKNNSTIQDELLDIPPGRELKGIAVKHPQFLLEIDFYPGQMIAIYMQ